MPSPLRNIKVGDMVVLIFVLIGLVVFVSEISSTVIQSVPAPISYEIIALTVYAVGSNTVAWLIFGRRGEIDYKKLADAVSAIDYEKLSIAVAIAVHQEFEEERKSKREA